MLRAILMKIVQGNLIVTTNEALVMPLINVNLHGLNYPVLVLVQIIPEMVCFCWILYNVHIQ